MIWLRRILTTLLICTTSLLYAAGATGTVPVTSHAVFVSTDAVSYKRGSIVSIIATLTSGSASVPNAGVTFEINGANVGTKSTDSNGQVIYQYKTDRKMDAGIYNVNVTVKIGGQILNGVTSFVLN